MYQQTLYPHFSTLRFSNNTPTIPQSMPNFTNNFHSYPISTYLLQFKIHVSMLFIIHNTHFQSTLCDSNELILRENANIAPSAFQSTLCDSEALVDLTRHVLFEKSFNPLLVIPWRCTNLLTIAQSCTSFNPLCVIHLQK